MRDVKSFSIATLALSTAFLAGAVVFRAGPAEAQQAPPNYGNATVNANNRFIAATGSVGSGMSVLWLVDTETKRVLVYGTNSLGKALEVRAARNIEWDLKLDWLNDESQYNGEDMRRRAEKQRQPKPEPAKKDDVPPPAPPGGK